MERKPARGAAARKKPRPRKARPGRTRPDLTTIPLGERVFVNRNLRFSSLACIGFDLDHTLAHYDPLPVEELAFETTKEKLITERGYSEAIRSFKYDPSYVVRGLVVDRERGNVLKMDYFNFVSRAYHGRQRLASAARRDAYRAQRFILTRESHISVDTLFHLPEVYLFMCLVDYLELREGRRETNYSSVYSDVRQMIDKAHQDGSMKRSIVGSPDKYLRRDSRLGPTLEDFRRGGKKLFLLTNSEMYYTDALMSYLLPPGETGRLDWRQFFDLIIVDAGKPEFFLQTPGSRPVTALESPGNVPTYSGGDAAFLHNALGANGERVMYFGDHTYGDILRSKRTVGWRTAMIVPEVASESAITTTIVDDLMKLRSLEDARDRLELQRASVERHFRVMALADPGTSKPAVDRRRKALESARREMGELRDKLAEYGSQIDILARKCSNAYNRHWGSIFREENEITRFGKQLTEFADLYSARVSNFLHYPSNFYFRSPVEHMPHEL